MKCRIATIAVIFIVSIFIAMPAMAQSSAESETSSEANLYYSPTSNVEDNPEFANPVNPGYPAPGQFFANVPPTDEYVDPEKLYQIQQEFTRDQLMNMSYDGIEHDIAGQSFIANPGLNATDKLKVTFANLNRNLTTVVGYVVFKADEPGAKMEAVVTQLLKEGLDNGANVAICLNDGAKRVLGYWAWGVALGYVHARVSDGSTPSGGTGSAGAGVTGGNTSYRHEPWARVALVHIPQEYYNGLRLRAPKNNGINGNGNGKRMNKIKKREAADQD